MQALTRDEWERVICWVTMERQEGKTIVFTNGCFDLLHVGHVQSLRWAAEQGDRLVVGVNSDASVRRLKGDGRPVIGCADRVEVLAALRYVDAVVVFDDDTPEELIRALKPDILVKGADWCGQKIAGASFLETYGGKVFFCPVTAGVSTTAIIQRIRHGNGNKTQPCAG